MRIANQRTFALAVVIAVAASMCLLSSTVLAARGRSMHGRSSQAAIGAGRLPSATASSTNNQAWIYTSSIATSTPSKTTGTINIRATKGRTIQYDRANVDARFRYNGANWRVRITCNYPVSGQDFPGLGAVQFDMPVFGESLAQLNLPRTLAHIAVYGRATIWRNGREVVSNQPAIAVVTEAIHGPDQTLLSTPEENQNEIQLIVPGPAYGQKFVKGFPNGYFYVYWPNVTYNISGNVQPSPRLAPAIPARGPVSTPFTVQEPIGTIAIGLTSTGINTQVSQAPSGLYDITITNDSNRVRGVILNGQDLANTPYTRFSDLLGPGGSQTFRWFFAPGTVTIKDFTGGVKTRTAYTGVTFGGHSAAITFQ